MKENAYTGFAKVYDCFMRNIPYEAWAQRIESYLKKHGFAGCPVLELGCGTGSFTIRMAKRGYRMTGIDLSAEMLKCARMRTRRSGMKIRYEQQDMRALYTERSYPVILSVCDSMNYLKSYKQLLMTFERVSEALKPGGIFVFDLKTDLFFRKLGNRTFTDEQKQGFYIWNNEYDAKERSNYYDLTFFVRTMSGCYRKYKESHIQHAFTKAEVESAAMRTGLFVKDSFGADFSGAQTPGDKRIYFVLGKEIKR